MNISRVRPRLPLQPSNMTQCCVPMVDSKEWAEHYLRRRRAKCDRLGWDYNACGRGASVVIDGKPYCGQHGGQLALAHALNEEVDWNQPYDKENRT